MPITGVMDTVNIEFTPEDFEDLREAVVGVGEIEDSETCDRILAAFDAAADDAERLLDDAA